MSAKMKVLSVAVAAFVVSQSVSASAIEPLNMKRVTDEDKIYFATRLTVEQGEKLQQIINHQRMRRPPCEKIVDIAKTLRFVKEVHPIFQEASTSADISSYARRYSAAIVKELDVTTKSFTMILPYYQNACDTAAGQKEAGLRPD